jgi:site-specific DNA-methyltransferase (adenine-specific)
MRISEERARTFGEVLTPSWMVHEMLSPVEKELPHFRRILDLCSGPGAFITSILRRLLSGVEPNEVLPVVSRLYAIELLPDNLLACREQLHAVLEEFGVTPQQRVLADVIFDQNLIQRDVLISPMAEMELPVWNEALLREAPDTQAVANAHTVQAVTPDFFDYIISNPPYQKNISGSDENNRLRNHSKATPIYQHFFNLMRELNPRFFSIIMPAKWYTGGWGLNTWRETVISDVRIRIMYDYRDSNIIFPGTEVNGGICWLLWDRENTETPRVKQFNRKGELFADEVRPLQVPGSDFFIRDHYAQSILDKIGSFQLEENQRFSSLLLPTTPFGIASNFTDYRTGRSDEANILLYYIKKKEYWVRPEQVTTNSSQLDSWKIFLSLSYNQHSPQIINQPAVYGPGAVCTHSYVAITGFHSQQEAENCVSYMKTKFFRFLAHQLKISPIATKQVYRLAPIQSWSKPWTDAELYVQYGLDKNEQAHIEKTISPML